MENKKTYTIQISQKITVSKTIKAETVEDALEKAREIENSAHGEKPLVKPVRGWGEEWKDETEVVGVFG